MRKIYLSSKQKAHEVNKDPKIYGTFAEIGAGQETVRTFFRAGGASKTVAKAMSAYDKAFSDDIYGKEENGRYVCKNRIEKMLVHETALIEKRLDRKKLPDKTFFVYANTVTTIDYKNKSNKGHGWVGIQFQLTPEEVYSKIVLHLNFHQNEAQLQQETLGELGTNLIYGAYFYNESPRELLISLYDNISKDKIEIDTINFSGPRFKYVDNRLMSLILVKEAMADSAIFGPDGTSILASELLFKKNIFILRGSFRPVTKVNMDMIECGLELFLKEKEVNEENIVCLCEITLDNLTSKGDLDERDFLDRINILQELGQTVMISRFPQYYKVIDYLTKFSSLRMAVVMGVNNFSEIFDSKYYDGLKGGIFEALGRIFTKNINLYLYPFKNFKENKLFDSTNLSIPPELEQLYQYLKSLHKIKDIPSYKEKFLGIYSYEVLEKILNGENSWEKDLPKKVASFIKKNHLFGYKSEIN